MTSPESTQVDRHLGFVRRAMDAFNRGDLAAMLELAGEDFGYDWTRSVDRTPAFIEDRRASTSS